MQKFDDDIMFIQEKGIDAMLREKLSDRFWIVSANVINHTSKYNTLKHHNICKRCYRLHVFP